MYKVLSTIDTNILYDIIIYIAAAFLKHNCMTNSENKSNGFFWHNLVGIIVYVYVYVHVSQEIILWLLLVECCLK